MTIPSEGGIGRPRRSRIVGATSIWLSQIKVAVRHRVGIVDEQWRVDLLRVEIVTVADQMPRSPVESPWSPVMTTKLFCR